MTKFPADIPIDKIINILEQLGFYIVREGNHISMARDNADGTRTPLTIAESSENKRFDIADYPYASGYSQR